MNLSKNHFKYFLKIQTRWSDNDVYNHINNVQYYSFFDTVINHFLIKEGELNPRKSEDVGLCVESKCQYFKPLTYPDIIDAGLVISKVGNSSLRYEIGIFHENDDKICAHGHFVHVFVNEQTRKPSKINKKIKEACLKILDDEFHSKL